MNRARATRTLRAARPRNLGLGLIELMVSLVLGLIVTASALALVLSNQQTFTATENLSRVQESARIAFELLNRDLRTAGGNFCNNELVISNGLNNPAANWWSDWDADSRGIVESAGSLVLIGSEAVPADDMMVVTDIDVAFNANPISVNTSNGVAVGDLMVICNNVSASLFRVTGTTAGGIAHAQDAANDGNRTAELAVADPSIPFAAGSPLAKVRATRWYVAPSDHDGDGTMDGSSLYRDTLVNTGGTLGVSTDEIVTGVTAMDLGYLETGGTDYVASPGTWANVVAVRVTLSLAGEDEIDGASLQRTLTHTVALRGRAG